MFSKKRVVNKLKNRASSANRRKRMLANNKKKVLWRNRAFVSCSNSE